MKIKSVYISAFGGLEDKRIDFTDGFNVFYGENEKGKTTVMNFIKMMFYGTVRGSAQISKDIRKKYTPWSGKQMAGSVDFVLNGKNYRLERIFKSSNSTDKVNLIDLDLGVSKPADGSVGDSLFGISSAAFERSVYIGQTGAAENLQAANGEINAKLSNMVSTGDESVSYEAVKARLEKAKDALKSKSGKIGEYDKNIKRIGELKEQYGRAAALYAEYDGFKAKADRRRAAIAEELKKAAGIKQRLDKQQDIRNAAKLREYLEKKSELDELNRELVLSDGQCADESFVKKVNFCIGKFESAESRLAEKSREISRLKDIIETAETADNGDTPEKIKALDREAESLKAERERIDEAIAKSEREIALKESEAEKTESIRKAVNVPLIAAAVVFAAASAVFGVISIIPAAVILAAAAAVFAVAGFLLRPEDKEKIGKFRSELESLRNENMELKNQKEAAEREFSEKTRILAELKAAAEAGKSYAKQQALNLEALKREENELKVLADSELNTLKGVFGRYADADSIDEIKAALEKISEKANKQKQIKQQLNYIAKDIGNISYEAARQKLSEMSGTETDDTDFEALKAEYAELSNRITAEREELISAETKARTQLENTENPDAVSDRIKELQTKAEEQDKFCRTAEKALEVLLESFTELRRDYGSELEKRAGAVFAGLTGGKYTGMRISNSFDISVEKKDEFGEKEVAYLSSGTADQAYLSLRLALSELMFEGSERLPVIMDDVLIQYDDRRMETAVRYLSEYSANGQTVMFTCRDSVFEAAGNAGASCRRL